jgi:hypothetical protein
VRLWEHYADDHRGVCLIFDRAALERALTKHLSENVGFGEVDYSAGGIAMTEADMLVDPRIFNERTRERAALDYIEQHRRELFFLKTDEWRSEHEFRAVLYDAANDYAFGDYGDALRGLVIGANFPGEHVASTQALADKYGIELKMAHWSQGLPWLIPAR